ncbi:MAG: D-alanyl-D-alanine carboxypeptidase [Paenibacillaceae bacterium]|jgi:D-alanyl-D-alanine carboxypeptidase|nr:D-alanyl-D-alanine carboxypeptidase [Paenibacillaceae bacterium]
MMRKLFFTRLALFLSVMLVLSLIPFLTLLQPSVSAEPATLSTHAQSASVIDVQSGRILYSQQGDKQMRIASLTKVMTAIVAIEHGDLADRVSVSSAAARKEGSSVYLKAGQTISLENLLYGLMLRSGNDAATAIAEHVGGSVEGFAYLMNREASMLGMSHSHFSNPSGLDAPDHYSTSDDMAKLTAYALKNAKFREIVKTKVKRATVADESGDLPDYVWGNKNKMLSLFPGADGVKTGYTKLAGRCLISSATRGGQQVAVVTLNDGDDWADHARALNYAFANYPLAKLVSKGEEIEGTKLVSAVDYWYPLNEEEKAHIGRKTLLGDPYSLDYRFGTLGRLQLTLNDKPIATLPLSGPGKDDSARGQANATFNQMGVGESGDSPNTLPHLFIRVIRALFLAASQE